MLLKFILGVCSIALLWGVNADPEHKFTDIAVDCNVNAAVLAINATALAQVYPDLDPKSLYVGESEGQSKCKAADGPRGTRIFHMSYGDCDPELQEFNEGGVRVVYTVRAKRIPDDQSDSDDLPEIRLKTSCLLSKSGLQSAKLDSHSSVYQYVGDNSGPYKFQMTVYKDAFMTNPLDPDDEIPLGSPLWVGVKFNRKTRAEMYIRDCWATSTPGGEDFEHTFIRNSVIGEDDETFIPVDDVITANSYGFSFDAFMFRGATNRVYVKCNVHVCTPEYTLEHPDICTTPTYPAFYRGERDLSLMDFSGSGSGYMRNFEEVSQTNTAQRRKKRDVSEEPEEDQETKDDDSNDIVGDVEEILNEERDEFEEEEENFRDGGDEEEDDEVAESKEKSARPSQNDLNEVEDEDEDFNDEDEDEESGSASGSGSGSGEGPDGSVSDEASEDTSLRFEAGALDMHREFPVFQIMHSFKVRHTDRKRKSAGSSRVYPKRTLYSTIRNGITLGIIIASTAMISACAVLLPLLFSGEKMRCLHVKPVKRVI